MARPQNPVPAYLLHKATGKARVRLKNGSRCRDVCLGEYGSPESHEAYRRVIAEHFGRDAPVGDESGFAGSVDSEDWTVAELAVKYDDFARRHFVKNGEPTDDRYRAVIGPLVTLFGDALAREFGPKKLKALREAIVKRGNIRTAKFDSLGHLIQPGEPLGREYVNNLIKSVVRMLIDVRISKVCRFKVATFRPGLPLVGLTLVD